MYKFSSAFADPQGSPIRALFKYLSEPEMISFAGGYPDPTLFDTEGLQEAAERAYSNSRACLEYGGTEGTPQMKSEVMRFMHQRGVAAKPESIIVTTGSQQAFDLLLRVLIEPGDRVFVEQPTYSTNIQALRNCQARIGSVPVDGDGIDIDTLERMLVEARASGEFPRMLYTIPMFSNPSGATMTRQRRVQLLELAVRYQFVIVEDDPYSDLRFAGKSVPSLMALSSEVPGSEAWVVHMASLSKIVAPGLRVAWAIAPHEILRRCSIAKQSADIGSSPWTQNIAAEYLASGRLDGHLEKLRAAYGRKCRALCAGLHESVGDALDFLEPSGGMFVWARLKHGLDATDLLQHAIPRQVMFVPGLGFQAGEPDSAMLRLSFASPTLEQIKDGTRRLGEAVQALQQASSSDAFAA